MGGGQEAALTGVAVRCGTCLRVERWDGETRAEVVAGGRRRPAGPPELAAWQVVRATLEGGDEHVVAACPGCGQPMVAVGLPRALWRVPLPDGHLEITDRVVGPQGPVTLDQADAQVRAAYTEPTRPAHRALEIGLMLSMAAPIALWFLAVYTVFWFLVNYVKSG